MSWHYLQEQAAAFSVELYLAGLRSARAKSSPTPAASCSTTRNSEISPASPSGTTSAPLTESHSEATSTSLQEASPVRTSRQLGKEPASPAPAQVSGLKCTESFAKYDLATHSWKTPQCSLLADLDEYSETWPKAGIMLHGACWELPTAAPPTAGTESGFLHMMPTPTACNAPTKGSNTHGPKSLLEVARTDWNPGETWRTPQASDWKHTGYSEEALARRRAKGRQLSLGEQVRTTYPTPTAHDAHKPHKSDLTARQGGRSLAASVMYPTPTCQDATNNGGKAQTERHTPPLNAVAGGALNPVWVEWLMGWPLGWTDLKHSATARFRSWRRQHSKSLNTD